MSWPYPLIMFAALLTGALLWRFTQKPPPMTTWEKLGVALGGFCGGMLGAKLPFLLADLPGLLDGSAWFDNGKTIVSGLVGGYLGVQVAEWAMDIRQRMCDSFAVPLAGAIAVGRLACFSAGCCYGRETSLPWGVDFGDGVARHPTQLYESLFHVFAAVVLLQLQRRELFRGQLVKLYFLSYFAYRFLTEFIRPEPRLWFGLTGYQYAVLVLALFIAVWCCRGCQPLGPRWLTRWAGHFFAEGWTPPKRSSGHFVKETATLCPTCLRSLSGQTYEQRGRVFLQRTCPEHGEVVSLVSSDRRQYYLRDEAIHPALNTSGSSCCSPAHKTCVALLEITDACNLQCPICFANSPQNDSAISGAPISGARVAVGSSRAVRGPMPAMAERLTSSADPKLRVPAHPQGRHRPFAELCADLDGFLQQRGGLEVLQLSGGEPLLHPDLLRIVDYAKSRPIDAIMVNTNGLELLRNPRLATELARRTPRLELYLQFDGIVPENYRALRGADLLDQKLAVLHRIADCNIPATLVCTVVRGVNEDQLGGLLQLGLSLPHVRGICFQPATWTGRFQRPADPLDRITLADVVHLICGQSGGILAPEDLQPLPCSHPNCCSFTVLARRRGRPVMPLTRVARLADHLDRLADRVNFDLEDARRCCRNGDNPAEFFRVFIKPFMDAHTFDAERADECCVHMIRPGGRAVSFCRFNTLERHRPESGLLPNNFVSVEEVLHARRQDP